MSSSRSEDELKVPSQRSDEARRSDEAYRNDEARGNDEDRDRAYDPDLAGEGHEADDGYEGRRAREDGGTGVVRGADDRFVAGGGPVDGDRVPRDTPATHGHTPTVPTTGNDDDALTRAARTNDGTSPYDDESPYKAPYAGGDAPAEPERDPDPAHSEIRADDGFPTVDGVRADDSVAVHDGVPADETPSHAAPQEVALFDQDPAQVQARWRDLQASFVDDPGEAVQRADGLVGEVVESLTSSLTTRTHALRERWKDVDSPDTEDLRQAFRDYRNVLERLLALSSHTEATQVTTQVSAHETRR